MSKLSEILPKSPQRLIDLVKAAGVDVSDWGNFKGGKSNAARNPKYCYEWSFVEPNKVVVLNLWHGLMEENDGGIITLKTNMREYASKLTEPGKSRSLKMDLTIQKTIKEKLPIRVIVLGGKRRHVDYPADTASQVSERLLDPLFWAVTAYDIKTGECTLSRGADHFVDQFSIPQETIQKPQQRGVSGMVFVRNPLVRINVLLRAKGKCEWCDQPGFTMADGKIYLETHHVIPLSEDGLDTEKNVAAICPNHHREAHHGKTKEQIRKGLLERLGKISR